LLLAGLKHCRQTGLVIQLAVGEAIGVLARGVSGHQADFHPQRCFCFIGANMATWEIPIGKFVRSKRKRCFAGLKFSMCF
jgi:hypothetical protein